MTTDETIAAVLAAHAPIGERYQLLPIPGTELHDEPAWPRRPNPLTGHALELFKRGLTVAQATFVANGACPVCFHWHGPKACAELRAELMRD